MGNFVLACALALFFAPVSIAQDEARYIYEPQASIVNVLPGGTA